VTWYPAILNYYSRIQTRKKKKTLPIDLGCTSQRTPCYSASTLPSWCAVQEKETVSWI
jgi:hypothetical protein